MDDLRTGTSFFATFQVAFAPFSAGELASRIDLQLVHHPPLTRHLPRRQARQGELFEVLSCDFGVGRNTSDDGFPTLPVRAGDPESQASAHLRMF